MADDSDDATRRYRSTPLHNELAQEGEDLHRLALRVARVGTFVYDIQTGAVEVSPELLELYGVPHDANARTIWRQLVPPEDVERARQIIEAALARRARRVSTEFRAIRPDGDERWMHGRLTLTYDTDGEPRHIAGVNVDITDRKRSEEALREADRHKDEFLAMLGHELRNPLAAIRHACDIMNRSGELGDESSQVQDILERQATHMARLVDELLDISRISQGKFELRRRAVDLNALVAGLLADRESSIAASGLTLVSELGDEPLWVHGDPVRLGQVVDNLLVNATKFTAAPGTITVTAEGQGSQAVVKVGDTGQGIAPTDLETIFEPFHQGPQDLSRSDGGLGLGLALAHRIIELHGGSIQARSGGEGTGAEFEVTLHLRPAPAQTDEEDAPQRRPCRRVLVIEDNVDTASLLVRLLELTGHTAWHAETGSTGLAMAVEHRPDVILCDIGLPQMDGFAVARAVRADDRLADVVLVALTGYGRAEVKRQAREAGFDEHLVKPVGVEEIQAVLARRGCEEAP